MKKTITKLAILIGLACNITSIAQTVSFDTFTLSPNSYYLNNAGTDSISFISSSPTSINGTIK
jgi:hypothetical protein